VVSWTALRPGRFTEGGSGWVGKRGLEYDEARGPGTWLPVWPTRSAREAPQPRPWLSFKELQGMRRQMLWCVLALLATVPARADQKPARLVEETWDAAYVEGAKTGYYHTT